MLDSKGHIFTVPVEDVTAEERENAIVRSRFQGHYRRQRQRFIQKFNIMARGCDAQDEDLKLYTKWLDDHMHIAMMISQDMSRYP